MKKLRILVVLLFSIGFCFSQQVKVKKGKVLFDGKAVVNLKTKGRSYIFSNLDNPNKKLVATLIKDQGADGFETDFLDVKDPETERTRRVQMEWFAISMNFKKGVSELMAKKYDVITEKGIQNLDVFYGDINTSEEDVTEEQASFVINNITKQNGYIIKTNKEGEKTQISGAITMIFDKYNDGKKDPSGVELDMRGAHEGLIDYVNDKGEEAHMSFMPKNTKVFIENESGDPIIYDGFRIERTETLNSMSNLNNALNRMLYYEVIYDSDKIALIKNPIKEKEFGIKIPSKKTAYFFLLKNKDKNLRMLSRYLNCELPEGFIDFDFKQDTDIKKLISHYETSCK